MNEWDVRERVRVQTVIDGEVVSATFDPGTVTPSTLNEHMLLEAVAATAVLPADPGDEPSAPPLAERGAEIPDPDREPDVSARRSRRRKTADTVDGGDS